MSAIRPKLLERLIGKKLYREFEEIISLADRGFDVAVQLPSAEIYTVFLNLCEAELTARQLPIAVVRSWDAALTEKLQQDLDQRFAPLLYVGLDCPPPGSGFIAFPLPLLDQLLPSISTTVSRILEHTGFGTYLDVFDARKMSKIKRIANTKGLGTLIDVVVQTAYLAGLSGNERGADDYLNALSYEPTAPEKSEGNASFTTIIEDILKTSQSPHCYLKAALSYYVVRAQGNTMTKASLILNISRTTLQQHLRLAEKFRVYELFEQTTS